MLPSPPCAFPGCAYRGNNRGLCSSHRRQANEGRELRPLRARRGTGTPALRDAQGRKFCPKCSRWLDPSVFARNSASRDGLHGVCSLCGRMAKYNLTALDYERMLTAQRGRCASCKATTPGRRGWHVDHDHSCCPGERSCGACVGGLLCRRCNMMFGMAEGSVEILASAINYLEATRVR